MPAIVGILKYIDYTQNGQQHKSIALSQPMDQVRVDLIKGDYPFGYFQNNVVVLISKSNKNPNGRSVIAPWMRHPLIDIDEITAPNN